MDDNERSGRRIFHPFQDMKDRGAILRIRRVQPQVLREGGLIRVWIFAASAGAVLIDQASMIWQEKRTRRRLHHHIAIFIHP